MTDALIQGFIRSPHLQRLGIGAAEEIRQAARVAFTELFAEYMRQVPASLTEAAAKITNPEEKRVLAEQVRALSGNTARWVETYAEHIDAHLTGIDLPERGDAGESSRDVGIAELELRSEARYRKLVTELDARVNRVQLMLYVPVYTKALAPAGLYRSLEDTTAAMEWPPRQRKMLFEKFDQLVVPKLEAVYTTLIEIVTRISANVAKATAEAADESPLAATLPKRPKKAASAIAPPSDTTQVDPESLSMLQTLAMRPDGTGYTDGLLAADLLALADHKPLPGVKQDQSWVPIQRISLAGHFLNEVISDSMVPDEFRYRNESVRMPLLKSALTDESLFTGGSHPLGSIVHELLLKSATSRITGNTEARRMAELLEQVVTQFDLSPEFVRTAMANTKPVEESQIQRFFELQKQQAQQRRDFVIAEAKRMIIKQIEHATFGRGMPDQAVRFLMSCWGPLLTKRLLQHGSEHPLWKAGIALMEQLLDQLDDRHQDAPPGKDWLELMQVMRTALVAEGMGEDTAATHLNELEKARKAPHQDVL